MIKAVVFDFGGVLASEGFKEGLRAIARKNGLDPERFYSFAEELIYESGYVTGVSDEKHYWETVRQRTGVIGSDEELREEILKRFIVRTEMIHYVQKLRASGMVVAILSDQTNWLDEVENRNAFYNNFDHVFNSFKTGKSKRDPSVFRDVCAALGLRPKETLFVDDNTENIDRALREGLQTLLFTGTDNFRREIMKYAS